MAKHAADNPGPANVTAKGYVNGGLSFYGIGYDPNEKNPACQWPASIVTYDAMLRQDAQVTSVLRALVLPILRTSWKLDPAGADDEVVDLVADAAQRVREVARVVAGHLVGARVALRRGHAGQQDLHASISIWVGEKMCSIPGITVDSHTRRVSPARFSNTDTTVESNA